MTGKIGKIQNFKFSGKFTARKNSRKSEFSLKNSRAENFKEKKTGAENFTGSHIFRKFQAAQKCFEYFFSTNILRCLISALLYACNLWTFRPFLQTVRLVFIVKTCEKMIGC